MLATGRVMTLDNQIDTTTGTVKLRAQFDNADNALFPNQFVNAQLLVKTLHNVVRCRPRRSSAARRAPTSTSSSRQHGIGAADQDRPDRRAIAAVESGLSVGDRVVVDGADRLRDGARVIIPGARSATPAAGNSAPEAQPPGTAQPPGPSQNRSRSGRW